ncbi:MAG: hypothetical protein ABI257_08410 [Nitrosospira sp.]
MNRNKPGAVQRHPVTRFATSLFVCDGVMPFLREAILQSMPHSPDHGTAMADVQIGSSACV